MPCAVRRGNDAVMQFDFTSPVTAYNLTPQITAIVFGLPVNYPLPAHLLYSCGSLVGTSCPVWPGEFRTLGFRFPVNSSYPPIPVAVQLTLRAHDNSIVSCFGVDISVRF